MTRRRLTCLTAALTTIALGLIWRLAPLHLPFALYKYGGSILWAAMLYWLIASALPTRRATTIAILAAATASAVELFKLVHTPPLEAFRLTLARKLLLGRFFSSQDLLAYAIAIAITATLDHRTRPPLAFLPKP